MNYTVTSSTNIISLYDPLCQLLVPPVYYYETIPRSYRHTTHLMRADISWPSQVHLLWTRSSQPCIPWIDQGAPSIGPWQVKVHLTWGTTRHFLVHICHWNDNQTCGRVIPAIKWDHITVSNILHIDKCNLKGYNLQFFLFLTHALYLLFLSCLHQICPSTYCGLAGRGLMLHTTETRPLSLRWQIASMYLLLLSQANTQHI